ncbi:MAG: RIP metalloprotease RseP [Candidatus Omnitrophica bacterium]|nr:RIP metalloprotease RseP [Candidatus Omnitrophota bacterium]
MLGIIQNIVPTLVVLSVLIFIHELGHFLFAKLSGVAVEKFSLGFGPELIKFSYKGTVYALSLIPLGGFVKLAGEVLEDRKEGELKPTDYLSQSLIKRFAIIFSGPCMNYLLAFILLIIVFMSGSPSIAPVIGDIIDNFPAQEAGIIVNDRVIAVDSVEVSTWDEMRKAIGISHNEVITLQVLRGDEERSITLMPKVVSETNAFGDEIHARKIGVVPGDESVFIKYSFPDAVKEAAVSTYSITTLTYRALYRLVTGRLTPRALSGPLGIIMITNRVAKQGIVTLMQFTAFLSISLAIFNLLPIPALDGGHLFFIIFEAIFRKPVNFKLQERFAQVGFTLLMVLMLFVVWNDAINFNLIEKIKQIIPFIK